MSINKLTLAKLFSLPVAAYIFLLLPSVSHGDITITLRQGAALFDVFANVGPQSDRLRISRPVGTEPTGLIEIANQYNAFAFLDNDQFSGIADSHGSMNHLSSVRQTPNGLAIDFLNGAGGMIETAGDGGAFSTSFAILDFRFELSEDTPYEFLLNISEVIGRSDVDIVFRSIGAMPLTLIDTQEAISMEDSGVLPAGGYVISIFTQGVATSANMDQNDDPPYSFFLNFSLRVGEVVPGDINLDGVANLLDVEDFIALIATGNFQFEGDFNDDSIVNLLDIGGFIAAVGGG